MANFDLMVSIPGCGVLKNCRFVHMSCSFNERAPAMKLTCLTRHSRWCLSILLRDPDGYVLILRNLFCSNGIMIRNFSHSLRLQDTKLSSLGFRSSFRNYLDRYAVRAFAG
jgi:hypothetical protein